MLKPILLRISAGILLLCLTTLACRPVITIGWQEIVILVVILLILLGAPLFRLYKRLDEFRSWKNKKGKPED